MRRRKKNQQRATEEIHRNRQISPHAPQKIASRSLRRTHADSRVRLPTPGCTSEHETTCSPLRRRLKQEEARQEATKNVKPLVQLVHRSSYPPLFLLYCAASLKRLHKSPQRDAQRLTILSAPLQHKPPTSAIGSDGRSQPPHFLRNPALTDK